MDILYIFLLGKFEVHYCQQLLHHLDGTKVQELFSYLLLHRHRPHSREYLAALLWPDVSTAQSKAYLRKTLWQVQQAFDSQLPAGNPDILQVDTDWVQLNPQAKLWLDVDLIEESIARAEGVAGHCLSKTAVDLLAQAIDVYRGDLLEGCYLEWCLQERERIRRCYLILLDKLMEHCLFEARYDTGLLYGSRILRIDLAREHTHRHIMELYYLAGDRTEALRQYERCVSILERELGVAPSSRTTTLYQAIRNDRLPARPAGQMADVHSQDQATINFLQETLLLLQRTREDLTLIQGQLEQEIGKVRRLLTQAD